MGDFLASADIKALGCTYLLIASRFFTPFCLAYHYFCLKIATIHGKLQKQFRHIPPHNVTATYMYTSTMLYFCKEELLIVRS